MQLQEAGNVPTERTMPEAAVIYYEATVAVEKEKKEHKYIG